MKSNLELILKLSTNSDILHTLEILERKYHVPVMNLQRFFEFMLPAGSNFSFFKAVSSNIQINVRYNSQTK